MSLMCTRLAGRKPVPLSCMGNAGRAYVLATKVRELHNLGKSIPVVPFALLIPGDIFTVSRTLRISSPRACSMCIVN